MLNEPGARGRVSPADIHEELLGEGENVPLGRREQRRARVAGQREELGPRTAVASAYGARIRSAAGFPMSCATRTRTSSSSPGSLTCQTRSFKATSRAQASG